MLYCFRRWVCVLVLRCVVFGGWLWVFGLGGLLSVLIIGLSLAAGVALLDR